MDKKAQITSIIQTNLLGDGNTAVLARRIAELLDDTSFRDMQEYHERAKILMSCYQCALFEIETKFRVLNERFSIQSERNPIDSIKTRIKSPESIQEKLIRKNLPFQLSSLETINDIAGVRVICSFVDDIYMLADCLLQQDDIRLIQRKDYIQSPKKNGYRSLHLIVEIPIFLQEGKRLMKVEVQLRTIAMEFWASLEHKLRYKKDLPAHIAALTAAELMECAEMSTELDLKMQKIRDVIEQEHY